MSKKITYIVTKSFDNPELATIPFMMAVGAMAVDVTPVIVLQGNGVYLAAKGNAEHITFPGLTPLPELIESYVEAGNEFFVCGSCLKARNIGEGDLIKGAKIVGAAIITEQVLDSINVLNY